MSEQSDPVESIEALIATLVAGQARVRAIAHERLPFETAMRLETLGTLGLSRDGGADDYTTALLQRRLEIAARVGGSERTASSAAQPPIAPARTAPPPPMPTASPARKPEPAFPTAKPRVRASEPSTEDIGDVPTPTDGGKAARGSSAGQAPRDVPVPPMELSDEIRVQPDTSHFDASDWDDSATMLADERAVNPGQWDDDGATVIAADIRQSLGGFAMLDDEPPAPTAEELDEGDAFSAGLDDEPLAAGAADDDEPQFAFAAPDEDDGATDLDLDQEAASGEVDAVEPLDLDGAGLLSAPLGLEEDTQDAVGAADVGLPDLDLALDEDVLAGLEDLDIEPEPLPARSPPPMAAPRAIAPAVAARPSFEDDDDESDRTGAFAGAAIRLNSDGTASALTGHLQEAEEEEEEEDFAPPTTSDALMAEDADDDDFGTGEAASGGLNVGFKKPKKSAERDFVPDISAEVAAPRDEPDHLEQETPLVQTVSTADASLILATRRKAEEQMDRGQMDQAIVFFGDLIELDPTSTVGYLGRGRCYLELGEYGPAMSDFQRSEDLDPRSPDPVVEMGNLFFARKDYRRAIDYYNAALELDEKCAIAWCRRGICHHYRKESDQAYQDLQRAYSLDPNIPNIRKYVQMASRGMKG